jgi:chorismate mutase
MKLNLKITPLKEWFPGYQKPLIISGPCSAESETQILSTAHAIKSYFPNSIFRAGIWKPRTRPNSFEGVGTVGLKWLQTVKKETGMMVSAEVANARHVEESLKHGIDILWIGARTTVNPFSVQEIADALRGTDMPIFIKNPLNPDLQLWIGALERVNNAGISKICAVHRGFYAYNEIVYRNAPRWEIAIELKTLCPELPIICDPSHICGNVEGIPPVAQKALDLDYDGLMIETHINPKEALSDSKQQVTPSQLNDIIKGLLVKKTSSNNSDFKNKLTELRELINKTDDEILQLMSERMAIAEEIGMYKKENNVTVFQIKRWEELLKKRIAKGRNIDLNIDFVKQLFMLIHEECIRIQTELKDKPEVHQDIKK